MQWVNWDGRPMLSLRDSLRLGRNGGLLVPQALVPLLALCDGTRDPSALRTGFLLRTGQSLLPGQVDEVLEALDQGFLLENRRYRRALARALADYRSAPSRVPTLAGQSYPEEPGDLLETLRGYVREAGTAPNGHVEGQMVGLISPHIDYMRGWKTYAQTWETVGEVARDADLVILLGTDHTGSPGSLTLTRQSYATPWGPLPTDVGLVDRLAGVLGEEKAFAEEAHHLGEHSIELASVWLHYVLGGEPKRTLPILCGPHQEVLAEGIEAGASRVWDALSLLAEAAASQRTLVVAAGDLSHVGPAFGDPLPLDPAGKARIHQADDGWLAAACAGAGPLKDYILEEGDPTRICGGPPIHYMLSILGESQGHVVTYDQCPADDDFGSLVSVVGVLYN